MINDVILLLLVFCAVAIGWFLGKRSISKQSSVNIDSLPSSYIRSLTFLISEQADEAIDQLITVFDVNEETFDTHIALGNVSRRRGELERAIKIHQNLLARPNLSQRSQDKAHYELARDYLQAGLLDRAEALLLDLSAKTSSYKKDALLLLISLYEDEKEWLSAIGVVKLLTPKRLLRQRSPEELAILLKSSHYYCELAEQALVDNDDKEARNLIHLALVANKDSLRAVYINAKIAAKVKDKPLLLKQLPLLLNENSKLLFKSLWLIDVATQNDTVDQKIRYIEQLYHKTQSASVLGLLVKYDSAGQKLAEYLNSHIKNKPTAKAIDLWLKANEKEFEALPEKLKVLQQFVSNIHQNKKPYQCHSCGFKSMALFWHCPTCKEWDSIELMRGEEFD